MSRSSRDSVSNRSSSHSSPVPAANITSLSQRTQQQLQFFLRSGGDGDVDLVLSDLKQDLEGQPVVVLEETLDWLRDVGAYAISVPLLEESWSAELPLDLLGRVAQDWIGTILFGVQDEQGAREVARHITPRAQELGSTFCSDLCDLLLEWRLFDEAEDLVRFVISSQPGDLSGKFHMGICAKMKKRWREAQDHFEEVLQHREDPATHWNMGIVSVAQHHWGRARQAWKALGFKLPDGVGDYAASGELSPVRLSCPPDYPVRSEVVWGLRVGPARLLLTGIPYYHPNYHCGDLLLIDGVKDGEVEFNGRTYPISPVLDQWQASTGETFRLFGEQSHPKQAFLLDRAAQVLGEKGWAIAHWTTLNPQKTPSGAPLLQLGLYLPPDQKISELQDQLTAVIGALPLYHPSWAERTGADLEEHSRALEHLGVDDVLGRVM